MTVYRLIKAGELRALQIGKSYRLREEDVDAFLAQPLHRGRVSTG